MTDNLTVFGTDFTGVAGLKVTGTGNGTLTYVRPQGTKSITANGTGIDVAAYSAVDVAVPSGQPNLQAKTNINPSTSSQTITADNGYDGLSSVQINAMPSMTLPSAASSTSSGTRKLAVSAGTSNKYINIPIGYNSAAAYYQIDALWLDSATFNANGTYNYDGDGNGWNQITVNVSGGGSSKNVQVAQSTTRSTSSTYTQVISLTCTTAGTYDVYWSTFRSSTSGTWGSQLYLGSTAYGTADTGNWSNHVQNKHLTGVSIAANQAVSVRVRTRGSNYYGYVGTLTIIQTA